MASTHAKAIVIGSVLLTIAAFYYTTSHLSINTDTDSMINSNLQFRQEYGAFNKLFPQLSDNFVIVVDAPVPELQTKALNLLAERLSDPKLYKSVFIPGYGTYFDKNGIMFLPVADLEKVVDRIAAAQPLLSPLTERPTLDTLFDQIASALENARKNGISPDGLEPVLKQMSDIAAARSAPGSSSGSGSEGSPTILSWQNLVNLGPVGAAGRHRFVIVQPALNKALLQPAKAALAAARTAAADVEKLVPGAKLSFTGKIALNNEELKSVSEGAIHASFLSFVAVALILIFGIGSVRLVLAALTTLVMGLIWTAGFAIFAVGYLNIVSVAFAVLFIGIGVDFAIHFILRFQEELGLGNPLAGALRVTGATAGKAIALGAPTTALAFFAFTPTDYHGLAQLGLISGTGIFIAVVTSLTVLPALCTLFPAQVKPHKPERHRTTIEFLSRRAGYLLIAGGVVTFVALIALPRAGFDFDPIRLKDQSSPSVKTYLMLAGDGAATPYSIQILVPDDGSSDAQMKEKLLALPQVARVVSVDSFVPKDQDKKLGILGDASFLLGDLATQEITVPIPNPGLERDALGRLQEALSATASYDKAQLGRTAASLSDALTLYIRHQPAGGDAMSGLREAYVGTLPQMLRQLQGALSPAAVSRKDLPADIVSRYVAPDGRLRLEVFPSGNASDQAVLKEFVDAVSTVAPGATGSAVQVVRAGEVIVSSMRDATLLAIGVITVFLFVVLRNPRDVALVVLPVAIATVATTAATVWFNVPFNFANVIALPLIIGLGVTGGTQIVIRARQDSRAADLLETNTPKAVILSALTNIASFASLAISPHWGTASMGILLAIGLIFMLATTLVLLPALLTLVERVRNAERSAAEA